MAAIAALVVVGIALLALGVLLWVFGGGGGPDKVHKETTTNVDSAPARPGRPQTTTTAVTADEVTTPGAPPRRSEAVVAVLLGVGGVLLLTGIFFGRIQEVTLPGGGGFKLAPAAEGKVVAKVAATAKEWNALSDNPETLEILYQRVMQDLRSGLPAMAASQASVVEASGGSYVVAPRLEVSPSDDYLDTLVARAAESVTR